MRSSVLAAALALVPFVPQGEPDLARDLGVAVKDVQPLAITADARTRVAALAGCSADDLAGARLFRGRTVDANGTETPCALVALPLGGAARGARVVFSVVDGRAHEFGLWGALDFDADPTRRWSTFVEQLRVAGTNETGATVEALAPESKPPRELEAAVQRLARGSDEATRLAYALFRQRQAMRRNGQWLAIARRGAGAKPEWVAELAEEMRALAELSRDLAPVLGEPGAARHAELASALADVYDDWHALLADDPGGDTKELAQLALASCRACHSASVTGGRPWRESCRERRLERGPSDTQLQVGYDLVRAIGDDGAVSQEIATKVKAGLLLAGALAR